MNTPARIMIVEDESIVALDLEQQLTDLGYSVPAIVSSGESAIAAALTDPPDLILMDIQLQDNIDGISAAKEILVTTRIPIVYLTAYADDITLNRARETEPHGYLVKPFNEETLRTTVEMALYKFKSERTLFDYAKELERMNKLLTLLNRLIKTAVEVKGIKDLLRMACTGLIEVLNLPYAFAVKLEQPNSPGNTLFECVTGDPQITVTQLNTETMQTCREFLMHEKPWIVQTSVHNPCLDILQRYARTTMTSQLFVLPLVVDDVIVGVIGLGAKQIEDISVNDIRAAWSIVTEIVNALEISRASERNNYFIEVLNHSHISILTTDQTGTILYANPAFEEITGYYVHEITGQLLYAIPPLLVRNDSLDSNVLQHAIQEGLSWQGTLEIHPFNSVSLLAQILLVPVENPEHPEIRGGNRLITPNDSQTTTSFICFLLAKNDSPNNS